MKSTDQNLSITLGTRILMGYRTYLPENYSESGDPMPKFYRPAHVGRAWGDGFRSGYRGICKDG